MKLVCGVKRIVLAVLLMGCFLRHGASVRLANQLANTDASMTWAWLGQSRKRLYQVIKQDTPPERGALGYREERYVCVFGR